MKLPKLNRSLKRLKQDAKELVKNENISHAKALDRVAIQQRFSCWREIIQINSINKNIAILDENKLDYAIVQITETGINKSIMDATKPLRDYFKLNNFHDYETQEQGSDNKILKNAVIVSESNFNNTKVSLYRPTTKQGDPRFWVYDLKKHVKPNDYLVCFVFKDALYVLNLNNIELTSQSDLIRSFKSSENKIAQELYEKLNVIAKKGLLKSVCKGDTAIGRTVETALGIEINSSKEPDYKGIEIKAFRNKNVNRKNLFAQVPNWKISECKSSGDIVDSYGYERDRDLKLYCTVNANKPNSQNLMLKVNHEKDTVEEIANFGNLEKNVVIWEGTCLRNRLLQKHQETFWIEAESVQIHGEEHFKLISIRHTKRPLINKLMQLIEDSKITIDHLIKRKDKTGSAKEKGPLFKIEPNSVSALFEEDVIYKFDD